MAPLYPICCTPRYYAKLWGGDRLGGSGIGNKIGEAWLLSGLPGRETAVRTGDLRGETLSALVSRYGDRFLGQGQTERHAGAFPLLIKLIDAAIDLSVQVHPAYGPGRKDEFWYFLDTAPDSRICLGLKEPMSREQLVSALQSDQIVRCLRWVPVSAGDACTLPAGTVHALGAGNLLIEVQDASDTTYRLYDYHRTDETGRPRTLHIEEALIHAQLDDSKPTISPLPGRTKHFTCSLLHGGGTARILTTHGRSLAILIGVSGRLELQGRDAAERYAVLPRQALLLPAETLPVTLLPGSGAALMVTLTPAHCDDTDRG